MRYGCRWTSLTMVARFTLLASCLLLSGCRVASPVTTDQLDSYLPSHNRHWRPGYVRLPTVQLEGDSVTLVNVRNARWAAEQQAEIRHYDRRFSLGELRDVDFIVAPFAESDLLAHTMLSFGLADGQRFVVSVEARLEENEEYSPLSGAAGAYELIYVVADERDVIPLRTVVRNVDCYVYPGKAEPDAVQRLFVDMAERINAIAVQPEFYNTLTNNCTTNIVHHVNRVGRVPIGSSWKILLPGRSDELAADLGLIDVPHSPFADLRPLYRVNPYVPLYLSNDDFSQRIRQHVPR